MKNKYDFDLLVTPEEFKKNKKLHRKAERTNKIKETLCSLFVCLVLIVGIIFIVIVEKM